MQTTEHDEQQQQETPADPHSQPLPPVAPVQGNEDDDDPEHIFLRAVAEIGTQPLPKKKREVTNLADVLEPGFLVSVLCFGLFGMVWLCITYPHTLVIVYAKATTAHITATLDVLTRTIAPVTITRSAATQTTGHGHQDTTAASGILTFYNGQLQGITVPSGSVFTGRDGERVALTQEAVIPAADPTTTPPTYGQTTVPAQAVHKGTSGNIAAFDINGSCCAPSVIVKNLTSFHNGQNARDYRAVAPHDLSTLSETVNDTLTQAFTTAFPLQQGEQALPTQCHATTSTNHAVNAEATSVTVTTVKTCSAVAYNRQELTRQAKATFEQTKPAEQYHSVGKVQATVQSVSPLTVTMSGTWVYTFSQDYQQSLAEQIAGNTPTQARKILLRTGVIAYASIPNTLPPVAMYINFVVLVG